MNSILNFKILFLNHLEFSKIFRTEAQYSYKTGFNFTLRYNAS